MTDIKGAVERVELIARLREHVRYTYCPAAARVAMEQAADLLSALSPRVGKEEIARIIDPSSWRVLDSYLAETKRKFPNGNYDPDSYKDKASLAKAEAILALLSPGMEGEG
jgi:hypothetical protein